MLREYSHKKSESLAQIHTTMTEIQHFYRGLFLLAYPVHTKISNVLLSLYSLSKISPNVRNY